MNKKNALQININLLMFIGMLASIAVVPVFAGGAGGVEKITIIECGRAEAADKSIFTPGKNVGVPFTIAINCYLIHHSKGNLLWDTGLSDGLAQYPDGHEVRPGVIAIIEKPLAKRLEDLGAAPDSIKHLALSHLHQDHAGNPNLFPNAIWYVQQADYDAAFGGDAKKYRYNAESLSVLKNNKTMKINGYHDVFGDGSVVLIPTPGHTPGHQVLYVELPSGPVILSGDLWHLVENRENNVVLPANFDIDLTYKSMAAVNAIAEFTRARVWIQHDWQQSQSLPHAPESIR